MRLTYQEKREIITASRNTTKTVTETGEEIHTYELSNKPVLLIFGGKRSKPDVHQYFSDTIARQNYINKFVAAKLKARDDKAAEKIALKAKRDELFKTIKVGDIFHEGGGYEQTNCYFYELVSLKGKTGTFRRISYNTVPGSEGYMCENRTPAPGVYIGEEVKARITGDYIKVGYGRAHKCGKDQSFYCSWYG